MDGKADHVVLLRMLGDASPWKSHHRRSASELPPLLSAGEIDLEDEYLHDPQTGEWRPLWRFQGVPCPPRWHDLVHRFRDAMQEKRQLVWQQAWTRHRYLEWRAMQLELVMTEGVPTEVCQRTESNPTDRGAWPDEPIPPHVRAQWECVRQIGNGGFGSVYLVRRHGTGAECALKVTKPGIDEHVIINELKSLERVRSPHVVQVREYVKMENGRWLIVTEYVPGMTLHAYRLAQAERRIADPGMIRSLLIGIARGLADLHRQGIVHRDLKPANIVLRESPAGLTPVIIDLGMARGAQQPGMTVQGGTPGYQSPEQQEGQPCTPASDVFVFGLVAYELVTGRPLTGATLQQLHEVCPALPEALDNLVKHKCASGLIDERFPDGTYLVAGLREVLQAQDVTPSTARGTESASQTESVPPGLSAGHTVVELTVAAECGDTEAMFELAERLSIGKGISPHPEEAARWYRRAAEGGLPIAMFKFGIALQCGSGVARNHATAVEWFQRAAEAGDANSMVRLGRTILDGTGMRRMPAAAAAAWFRRAAEAGNHDAMCNIAWCQETGVGVEQDREGAIEWYRRAAEAGSAHAMFDLGWCFETGTGTSIDRSHATAWYQRSVKAGSAAARIKFGIRTTHGTQTADQSDADAMFRIAERLRTGNDADAHAWYSRAAEAGSVRAMMQVARRHALGTSIAKDQPKAVTWLRLAAGEGNAEAMFLLAECLRTGRGVHRDDARARDWYRRSAEAGNPDAIFWQIERLRIGNDGESDATAEWQQRANHDDDADAMLELAERLRTGIGTAPDHEEAADWYRRAADAGSSSAMFHLGRAHMLGIGVARDPEEAEEWFRRAARAGHAEAMYHLGQCFETGTDAQRKFATQASWWLRRAADAGSANAMCDLGRALRDGIDCAEIHSQAMGWFRRAADTGHPDAMFNIGWWLLVGSSNSKEHEKAGEWLRGAALAHHREVLAHLGRVLRDGNGVELEHERAIALYRRAAEAGHAEAMTLLGLLLLYRPAAPGDPPVGLEWLRRAAEARHVKAMITLGRHHMAGIYTCEDKTAAIAWYRSAAEAGSRAAMMKLVDCLRFGIGTDRDKAAAAVWHRRARATPSDWGSP